MKSLRVIEVTRENIDDLCLVCIPQNKRDDPDWKTGFNEKKTWALQMLERFGTFAKLAYIDKIPAGMIQYHPIGNEAVVKIDCIYVPEPQFWHRGAGTALLSSLIEDLKKPEHRSGNMRFNGLIVHTFPGESEGQISAREFFVRRGFKSVGADPNLLVYPLNAEFAYQPMPKPERSFRHFNEDKGKVLLFCGPNRCPAAYPFFLKRMEHYIREIDRNISIIYVDISQEPEFARIRNAEYGDCVVNGILIKAFVLDKPAFQHEIKSALALAGNCQAAS